MRLSLSLCAGCIVFLTAPACAQTVSFTNIVSTKNTPFQAFFNVPALNNAGVIAFTAHLKPEAGVSDGLYLSAKPGKYQRIVRTSQNTDIEGFFSGSPPSVNNSGVVAFSAYRTITAKGDKRVGIFIALPGKAVVLVVQTSIPVISTTMTHETGFWGLQNPCLSDMGTVAFMADGRNKGEEVRGVYTVKNSRLTTIARTGPEPDFYGFDTGTAINRADVVAFFAYPQRVFTIPPECIYMAKDFHRTEPLNTAKVYNFGEKLSINEAGTVAFTGKDYALGNVACSVSPDTKRLKIVAQSPSPKFADNTTFGNIGINRAGAVAFDSFREVPYKGLEYGIYIRLPASAHLTRIIGTGDKLFGSVVSETGMTGRGLNDRNQIAFWYKLASGVEGIARASINEKRISRLQEKYQGRTRSTAAR